MVSPDMAFEFFSQGLHSDKAAEWIENEVNAKLAWNFHLENWSPIDLQNWCAQNNVGFQTIASYVKECFAPDAAVSWLQQEIGVDQACLRSTFKVTAPSAAVYLNKGILPTDLKEWIDQGFTVEEAVSWVTRNVLLEKAESLKQKNTSQQEGMSYSASCAKGLAQAWKVSVPFEEYVQEKMSGSSMEQMAPKSVINNALCLNFGNLSQEKHSKYMSAVKTFFEQEFVDVKLGFHYVVKHYYMDFGFPSIEEHNQAEKLGIMYKDNPI
ncbi:hypothetical protein DSO57_1032145 [Entomophthora muscae]|uniref:Uncharacterized protein n=1 Tax=Entomophthora muscae TaxID=34485 RepID=A0ACC2SDG6_9FUNG|nr:hypothetical protein DSO57_1032145 [Entomophthora muscae]